MSTENKTIAETLQMFTNLLFHIDDYIRNKKERKGQLSVSKNIRQVLREVISSIVNLKFFINNVIIGSEDIKKKPIEEINNQKLYIKTINPLSFNQKNLNNIQLFYNTNCEIFVINYLILDKIFSILKFCLKEIFKKKNDDYDQVLGRKNKNFVLNNMILDEFANDDTTSEENILRKMLKKKELIEKSRMKLNRIRLTKLKMNNFQFKFDSLKNNTVSGNKATSIMNSYLSGNYNNPNKIITDDDGNSKENTNYLQNQIRKIDKIKVPLIKTDSVRTIKILKNNRSLPLIYDKQILKHKMSNFYTREKKKRIDEIKLLDKTKNSKDKNKYLTEKISEYKIFPRFKNTMKHKFSFNNRIRLIKK